MQSEDRQRYTDHHLRHAVYSSVHAHDLGSKFSVSAASVC